MGREEDLWCGDAVLGKNQSARVNKAVFLTQCYYQVLFCFYTVQFLWFEQQGWECEHPNFLPDCTELILRLLVGHLGFDWKKLGILQKNRGSQIVQLVFAVIPRWT